MGVPFAGGPGKQGQPATRASPQKEGTAILWTTAGHPPRRPIPPPRTPRPPPYATGPLVGDGAAVDEHLPTPDTPWLLALLGAGEAGGAQGAGAAEPFGPLQFAGRFGEVEFGALLDAGQCLVGWNQLQDLHGRVAPSLVVSRGARALGGNRKAVGLAHGLRGFLEPTWKSAPGSMASQMPPLVARPRRPYHLCHSCRQRTWARRSAWQDDAVRRSAGPASGAQRYRSRRTYAAPAGSDTRQ